MSLQLAAASVRGGQTVAISPEGTRSTTGLLLPFKKGEWMSKCARE
jgi:1-acyl-sn-glycerol-3-phosphate acyltransferase